MTDPSKHLVPGHRRKIAWAPKRGQLSVELPAGAGARRDESIFIYRVLEVAHGLRYRSLDHLIGTEFVAGSEDSAEQDFVGVVGDYLDSARVQQPLLPVGAGTHQAYGFLDLALPAKRTLVEAGSLRGIPLLQALGFLTRQETGPFLCPHDFEALLENIRKGDGWLRLLVQDEAWHRSARGWWRKGGGTAPAEYQPLYPLRFRVVDAAIANSGYVWRCKHFYW